MHHEQRCELSWAGQAGVGTGSWRPLVRTQPVPLLPLGEAACSLPSIHSCSGATCLVSGHAVRGEGPGPQGPKSLG